MASGAAANLGRPDSARPASELGSNELRAGCSNRRRTGLRMQRRSPPPFGARRRRSDLIHHSGTANLSTPGRGWTHLGTIRPCRNQCVSGRSLKGTH